MRALYRLLSKLTTLRAATRGPKALGRHLVRRQAHKSLARALRRNRWTRP